MTRDYANYKRKRHRQTRRGLVVFLVLALCGLLPGFAFYTYRHELTLISLKEDVSQKLTAYFAHLHKDPKEKNKKLALAKKRVAAAAESVKPIHFDFYDELPKAQLDLPYEQATEEDDSAEEPKLAAATPIKKTLAAEVSAPAPVAAESTPVSASEAEANKQEEVVQELASDLSSMKASESGTPYILQLSTFHSLDAAKRYRAALASAGLKVDLVTLRVGKKVVYRLQQGPYHDMEQLKLAKKRLTERGVACDIQKLSPYMM